LGDTLCEIVSSHGLAKSRGDRMKQMFGVFLACTIFGCMSLKEMNSRLLESSAMGDTTKIKEMLERGANINTRDRYGRTPLHISLETKNMEAAKLLINSGANVNAMDALEDTPLHLSRYAKEERISYLLTERGADSTLTNKFGLQPVEMSGVPEIEAKVIEVAKLLSSNGDWIEMSRARMLYNGLKALEARYLINSIVLQVIRGSTTRLQVLILAIKLGVKGSEEKLASLLMVYGDKWMAEDYLNCGSRALDTAARQWAYANRYTIMTGSGSHRATWGRF
jgi:hypothetical protein